jgi:hypothetical protein
MNGKKFQLASKRIFEYWLATIFCSLFAFTVLSSCAKKGGSDKPTGPGETTVAPDPILDPITGPTPLPMPDASSVTLSKFVGTWTSACRDLAINADSNIGATKQVIMISNTQVSKTLLFFRDINCLRLVSQMEYSYTLQNIAKSGSSAGTSVSTTVSTTMSKSLSAYDIDLKLDGYTITPLAVEVATDYNMRSVCGLSNGWFVYNPRSVTSLECEPVLGINILGKLDQSILYDIIKLDESTSPATVFTGDLRSGSGSTSTSRPTAYSSEGLEKN